MGLFTIEVDTQIGFTAFTLLFVYKLALGKLLFTAELNYFFPTQRTAVFDFHRTMLSIHHSCLHLGSVAIDLFAKLV